MLRTEKKKNEIKNETSENDSERLFSLLWACRDNATDLLEEAKILFDHKRYARAYTLAFTADEEVSKGQYVADFISKVVSESEFKKAFRCHIVKASNKNIVLKLGQFTNTGTVELPNGEEADVFKQEVTLEFDSQGAKESFLRRNESMYVGSDDSYNASIPKDKYDREDASKLIDAVQNRMNRISFAEEFNGRIGTKALIK